MSPSQTITRTLKRKGVATIQDLRALGLSRPTLFRTLKALQSHARPGLILAIGNSQLVPPVAT